MTGKGHWLAVLAAAALAIPIRVTARWYAMARHHDDHQQAREAFQASVPDLLQEVGLLVALSLLGLSLGVLAMRSTRGIWRFVAGVEVVTGALLSAWLVWTVM